MEFQDFVVDVYGEIRNKHADTLTYLKKATARQLRELSSFRSLFMEEAGVSFDTIAGQATYGSDTPGFPPNILTIDRLYYESGSSNYAIPLGSLGDVRFDVSTQTTNSYPYLAAWAARKLHLAPTPSSVKTLKIDCLLDATLDVATGAEILETATTETNGWLQRGATALRFAVLADYFSSPGWRDLDAAAAAAANFQSALSKLREERNAMQPRAWLLPGYLSGEDMPTALG